ncbi:unnamed protein product [Clavelina lepadiformis]|uniref:Uncharacterized protein n=1 Tax=Clavelina lepadiformis TaxID=159417 RepID=A0ABP0FTC0_CLALP
MSSGTRLFFSSTLIRAKNPEQREMVAGHMAHLPSTQETQGECAAEQAHQGESSSSVPNPPSPDGASSQHSPARPTKK